MTDSDNNGVVHGGLYPLTVVEDYLASLPEKRRVFVLPHENLEIARNSTGTPLSARMKYGLPHLITVDRRPVNNPDGSFDRVVFDRFTYQPDDEVFLFEREVDDNPLLVGGRNPDPDVQRRTDLLKKRSGQESEDS